MVSLREKERNRTNAFIPMAQARGFQHYFLVKEKLHVKGGHRYWKCLCECGNETITRAGELKRGRVKSCGCIRALEGGGKKGGNGCPESYWYDKNYTRPPYSYSEFPYHLPQFAFRYYPRECEECQNNGELDIHHRNGDRSNNSIGNLQVLCHECHRKKHPSTSESPSENQPSI